MSLRLLTLLSTLLFLPLTPLYAAELPKLKVTVLHSGTVNWELEHLKRQQHDIRNGFELQIDRVASLSAARLALTSGSTDMIVSDWLWAATRNNAGDSLRFIPFSRAIGTLILAENAGIKTWSDLRGKRIGIAGGPLNKGWVLLQAAAKNAGVDLRNEAALQFGAPPLLSQALKRGQVDLLVTFWHYGARLEAEGYPRWNTLESLLQELGMHSPVPMLGYLFRTDLAVAEPELIAAFTRAVSASKTELGQSDQAWEALKPLMNAENTAIYQALITGYRKGIPAALTAEQINDVARFYQLVDQLSANPTGKAMDRALFYGNPH